jgi:hypothetical protein
MNKLNQGFQTSKKLKIFLALVSLILFFLTPISIFWDSYLYLGSANSLFTDSFLENYHWIREPGYPLLIRAADEVFGIQGLIFLQYILSWLSVILFIDSLKHLFKTNRESKTLYFSAMVSLAISAGYASSVLQQTSFIFLVSATMNLIVVSRSLEKKVTLAFLIAVFSSLVSVILFAGVLAILLFNVVVKILIEKDMVKPSIALFIVVLFAGSLVTSTWYGYKSNQDPAKRIYQDAWNFWEFENTWEFQDNNSIKKYAYRIAEVPSVIFALNQFGVETTYKQKGLVSGETQIFVANKFAPENLCGRYFPGPVEYIEKSGLDIPKVCRTSTGLQIVNFFHLILSPAIPFFGLVGFLIILYAPFLYGSRIALMLLIPMVSLSPYILSSAGASRYGAPQLIFAPLLIALIIKLRHKADPNALLGR